MPSMAYCRFALSLLASIHGTWEESAPEPFSVVALSMSSAAVGVRTSFVQGPGIGASVESRPAPRLKSSWNDTRELTGFGVPMKYAVWTAGDRPVIPLTVTA